MKRCLGVLMIWAGVLAGWNANYTVSLDQLKSTSNLTNSLSFSRELSSHLSLNGATSFTAGRNLDLERFTDSRNGRGWLSWRPKRGLEVSTEYVRNINLEERYGKTVRDEIRNSATGALRYVPSDWLTMNIQAGIHSLDYRNISGDSVSSGINEGSLHNVNFNVTRRLLGVVSTNLSLAESRSYGTETDTGRDVLTARVGYNFPRSWRGGSFNAEIGAARNYTTYHITRFTHKGRRWNHSATLVLPEVLPRIFVEMNTAWSYESRFWEEIDPDTVSEADPRDRFGHTRQIGSTIVWEMMDDLDLKFTLSRSLSVDDVKKSVFGVEELFDLSERGDDRHLSAQLVYTPGSSRITFHRVVNLYRFDTDGTWDDAFGNTYEDDRDYDELRELLGITARIPIDSRLMLKGEMQGQRRETIFLMSSMSGENRRSSTYTIRPGYEYQIGGGWKVDHSVRLSADYTTYFFPQFTNSSNRLSRRLESFLTFNRVAQDSTILGINHVFRFSDQGRYEDRLFSRTEEAVSSRLTLNMGFHVSRKVGITPSYGWEYSWRNRLDQGLSVDEHIHHVGLRSTVQVLGGVLAANMTRSFRGMDIPSYWKASMNFNYLL